MKKLKIFYIIPIILGFMAFSSIASAEIIGDTQIPSIFPSQPAFPVTRSKPVHLGDNARRAIFPVTKTKPAFPVTRSKPAFPVTKSRPIHWGNNKRIIDVRKAIKGKKIRKVRNIYNEDKNVIDNFRTEIKAKIKNGELTPKEAYTQIQQQMKIRITKARSEMKTIREEFRKKIGTKNISLRNVFKLKHKAIVKFIQAKQNDFNQEIEANKEGAKVKIKARRLLFLRGLEKVKNLKKRASIENISNRIQAINTKVVDIFTKRINRLDSILASIESRTDKVAVNNIDVSAIRNATAEAEDTISNARTNIASQATKVYAISITNESTAKVAVEKVRDNLRENIKSSRDLVKLANIKVRDALSLLLKIPKVNELNVPTTVETGTPTPPEGVNSSNLIKQ